MLFALGSGQHNLFSPVSFAETGVKGRIRNALHCRRLTRTASIILAIALTIGPVACVFNPSAVSRAVSDSDSDGDEYWDKYWDDYWADYAEWGSERRIVADDIAWTIDDEGTLTISGTGAMMDYRNDVEYEQSPWYDARDSIKEVIIADGITSIGKGAFYGCSALTSADIADSVRNIGESAFEGCTSLESITIPNSVTSIEDCAFWGCTSLADITIPNSVTYIGECAFCYCTSLTSITIPDSVTYIGTDTFAGCPCEEDIRIG